MKYLNILALFLTLWTGTQSQARNFYKTSFSLSASYTNIDTGSKGLFSQTSIPIRYSDDGDFCIIYFEQIQYPCASITLTPDRAYSIKVQVPRDLMVKFFKGIMDKTAHDADLKSSFHRLIALLPDGYNLSNSSYYSFQLHDDQPEAIHVWIHELNFGTQLLPF